MNFRVFASGLLMILAYQLAIAAAVIWFVVRCEAAAGGASTPSAAVEPPMAMGGQQ